MEVLNSVSCESSRKHAPTIKKECDMSTVDESQPARQPVKVRLRLNGNIGELVTMPTVKLSRLEHIDIAKHGGSSDDRPATVVPSSSSSSSSSSVSQQSAVSQDVDEQKGGEQAGDHSVSHVLPPSPLTAANNKLFSCRRCERQFPLLYLLKRHEQETPGCGEQADTAVSVSDDQHSADICRQSGETAASDITEDHHGGGQRNEQSRRRVTSNSPGTGGKCVQCGRYFPTASRLLRHSWTHDASLLPFSCDLCTRRFRDRYAIDEHAVDHRCGALIECERCGGAYKASLTMKRHLRSCDGSGVFVRRRAPRFSDEAESPVVPDTTGAEQQPPPENKMVVEEASCERRSLRPRCSTNSTPAGDDDAKQDEVEQLDDCGAAVSGAARSSAATVAGVKKTRTSAASTVCSVCHKTFSDAYRLTVHMRIHTGERPYKCHICTRRFVQRPHLARHFESYHHTELPYNCLLCGHGFFNRQLLQTHGTKCRGAGGDEVKSQQQRREKQREGGSPSSQDGGQYECGDCGRAFATGSSLTKHRHYCLWVRQRTIKRSTASRDQSKSAVVSKLLPSGKSSSYQCSACARRFTSFSLLLAHRRVHHRSSDLSLKTKTTTAAAALKTAGRRKCFRCGVCGFVCHYKSNLERHMKRHAADRQPHTTVTDSPGTADGAESGATSRQDSENHRCHRCSRVFASSKALTVHNFYCARSRHVTPSSSASPASGASRRSGGVSLASLLGGSAAAAARRSLPLPARRATNTTASNSGGRGEFRCQVCSKSFTLRNRLARHLKTHLTDKPFKCHLCGHGFVERCSLVWHMERHTDPGPCKCRVCGRRFSMQRLLTHHMRVIHKIRADQEDDDDDQDHEQDQSLNERVNYDHNNDDDDRFELQVMQAEH